MGLSNFFGFGGGLDSQAQDSELPEIYPLSLLMDEFIKTDVLNTYIKILTDTIERVNGLPDEVEPLLWDNCVQNESSHGLISLLAHSMVNKNDLFLVYSRSTSVIRKATFQEQEIIKRDYQTKGGSPIGIYISFRNYRKTDMLIICSQLEYCILNSFNKTVNLSKAVQVKVSELRSSVSLNDSCIAIAQARSIARALAAGKDIFLDVKDEIVTATPDISPTTKAIEFLDSKRAFYTGLPMSYVSGLQTPGIGSTGEADMRAVERGLKQYFVSIIRPVIKAVFGITVQFKSQDFRQISSALDALRTFELAGEDLLSKKNKRILVSSLFDIQDDFKGDEEKEEGSLLFENRAL